MYFFQQHCERMMGLFTEDILKYVCLIVFVCYSALDEDHILWQFDAQHEQIPIRFGWFLIVCLYLSDRILLSTTRAH